MSGSRRAKAEVRELRIIGGRWRSRKLRFDALPGVRPTPDRVRETLFNWLQPWISGSRCLDLFAGSGVLGFEALSRGANSVVFIDEQAKVVARLREQMIILGAESAEVVRSRADDWLTQEDSIFDLVFVDPPFKQGLVTEILERVITHCSASARIYVESEKAVDASSLPAGWVIEKSNKAARVHFHLLCRTDH